MKQIDGQCHCGSIKYEATVNPDLVVICHCADCQQASGTAFRTAVYVSHDNFKITQGEPAIYYRNTERGDKRKQAFCSTCGTPVYASDPSEKPMYSIRTGTARQRAELIPKFQIWCRSQLPWVQALSTLPQIPTQPGLK